MRKACQDASILAGLIDLDPQRHAEDAKGALQALLDEGIGSMEFGAAVSLLEAVREAELPGFAQLAETINTRAQESKNAKQPLIDWLDEQLKGWSN